MAIDGMHPTAHKKHWYVPTLDYRYPVGAKFKIEGDSANLWLDGYNVRVCTIAEVIEKPNRTAKKVYVKLSDIDHESDVYIYIRKSALKEHNRIGGFMVKNITTGKFLTVPNQAFIVTQRNGHSIWFQKHVAQNAIHFEQQEHPNDTFEIIPADE